MKHYHNHGGLGISLLFIAFYGNPDLIDAIIYYLTGVVAP